MGYFMLVIVLLIAVSFGVFYLKEMKKNAKKDARPRMIILQYFKEQKAIDFESGIKMRDLPKEIAKHPALLLLVQEGTLCMEKGRYFLNRK